MHLLHVSDYQAPATPVLIEPATEFRVRRLAVRAVLSDSNGRIYLLRVAAGGGYLKLPGGGVEPTEDPLAALHREVMEETGYQIKIGAAVGRTVQYDLATSFRQDSHCYLATITGGDGRTNLTQEEQDQGFELAAFPNLAVAIQAADATGPTQPETVSIKLRDLVLLRAASNLAVSRT